MVTGLMRAAMVAISLVALAGCAYLKPRPENVSFAAPVPEPVKRPDTYTRGMIVEDENGCYLESTGTGMVAVQSAQGPLCD